MKQVLTLLKSIQKDIRKIIEMVWGLLSNKTPLPTGYNPMGKRRCFSQKLKGGLTDPEVRSVIVRLKTEGRRVKDIVSFIRENWPEQPEKWVSRSACQRFWQNVRAGRLREYGIKPPFDF